MTDIKPDWSGKDTLAGIALEWVIATRELPLSPETCARFRAWLADPAHAIAYQRSAERYRDMMDLCRHLAALDGEPVPERKRPN